KVLADLRRKLALVLDGLLERHKERYSEIPEQACKVRYVVLQHRLETQFHLGQEELLNVNDHTEALISDDASYHARSAQGLVLHICGHGHPNERAYFGVGLRDRGQDAVQGLLCD